MNEIVRFIGWVANKYLRQAQVWGMIISIAVGAFVFVAFWTNLEITGSSEFMNLVAKVLVSGLTSAGSGIVCYFIMSVALLVFNSLWQDYRRDYPARKRKQKDA